MGAVNDSSPVRLSGGIPTTILPDEDPETLAALDAAIVSRQPVSAVEAVVAGAPRSLFAWAALGDVATSPVQRYAAYRLGYHRGLDALRANGWRGSGFVPSSAPSNIGFLRCVRGLAEASAAIGERDETERLAVFLAQIDPSGPKAGTDPGSDPGPGGGA